MTYSIKTTNAELEFDLTLNYSLVLGRTTSDQLKY
jgi:hypothetical protein